MQSSTIYTPPKISKRTYVIAVVGTTQELCAPEQDGWFLADFFLWHHFVAAITPYLCFLTCVKVSDALTKHSYIFGNPGQQDSRVVMNTEMYRELRESSNTLHDNGSSRVTETGLVERFMRALSFKVQYLRTEVNKILVLIFAHGSESRPMQFLLGNKFLSLQEIVSVFKDQPVNVEVEFVVTSLISGGWTSFTLEEALKSEAHQQVLDLRWLASTFDPLQYLDGQLDKSDLKHILNLLQRGEHRMKLSDGAENYSLDESKYTYFTYGDRVDDEIRSRSSIHGIEHDFEFATFCTNVDRLLEDIVLRIIRNNLNDGNCLLLLDSDSNEYEAEWLAHVSTLKAIYLKLPTYLFSGWYTDNRWLEPGPDKSRDDDASKTWVRLSQQGKPIPTNVANRALMILQGLAWNYSPENVTSMAHPQPEFTPFTLPGPYTHRKIMQLVLQIFNYRGRLQYFARRNHLQFEDFSPKMCRQIDAESESFLRSHGHPGIDNREVPLKPVASLCGHHFEKVFQFTSTREHEDDGCDSFAALHSWYCANYLRRQLHRNGVNFDFEKDRWIGFSVDSMAYESFRSCEDLFIIRPVYWYLEKHNLLRLARESPAWKGLSELFLNKSEEPVQSADSEVLEDWPLEPFSTQEEANLFACKWTDGKMLRDSCPQGEDNMAHSFFSDFEAEIEEDFPQNVVEFASEPNDSIHFILTPIPPARAPSPEKIEELSHPATDSGSDSSSDGKLTGPPTPDLFGLGPPNIKPMPGPVTREQFGSMLVRKYTNATDCNMIQRLLSCETDTLEYCMTLVSDKLPDVPEQIPVTEIFRVLTKIAWAMHLDKLI